MLFEGRDDLIVEFNLYCVVKKLAIHQVRCISSRFARY